MGASLSQRRRLYPAAMDAKALLVALAAALVCMPMPSHARPLKKVCDAMEPLRKMSDLKYVKPVIRVKPESESVKPVDVVFTIDAKSGPIRFAPKPDGTIEPPITDALCAENPQMTSNQPDDAIGFVISIQAQVPPARRLDYRQLEELRREWDEAVSRQGLMWRVLAPSPKAFQVAFEAGRAAAAEIHLPQGVRRLVPDASGHVVIPFEPAWIHANPAIVLSEMPKRIGLRFKD